MAQDQWCLTGYRAQYRHRRRQAANAGLYQDHLVAVNKRKATFAVLSSVNIIEKQEGKAAEKKLPEKSQGN